MVPVKDDEDEVINEGKKYIEKKKNIHARYNFNVEDLEIDAQKVKINEGGSVVISRKADKAYNADFIDYKQKKKVKKN